MESNNGRCGPLCQHPACWEADRTRGPSNKRTKINSYLQELLRLRSTAEVAIPNVETCGSSVLTVQNLVVEAQGHVGDNRLSTQTSTPHPSLPPHPPQLHRVEVLLQSANSSPSSSLSFSPVLIWRPGRFPVNCTTTTSVDILLGKRARNRSVAMKTHNLTDALPPGMSDRASRIKTTMDTARPQSGLNADGCSVDFFRDMPAHIVSEILHELHNDSSSTLTRHSADETTIFPDSSHIPASLLCNLSTGQLYRSVPRPYSPRDIHIPTTRTTSHLHTQLVLSGSAGGGRRKKTDTLPPVKKTSFSRQLSKRPQSVLRTTDPPALHKHHDHHTLTVHQTLLPATSFPPPSPVPLSNHHSICHNHVRYPLGNPAVPRTLQQPSPDPLLAPYPSQLSRQGDHKGCQNSFLQVCPAHVHNTRLVTLHSWTDNNVETRKLRPPLLSPLSEETAPLDPPLGPEGSTAAVHLPPLPSPCLDTPSLPLSYSTTCVSPDHMHVGAEIHGDQLVLEREGEQVVHPLRDTSQASMGGANTPTEVGVANGIQAPPPTANNDLS